MNSSKKEEIIEDNMKNKKEILVISLITSILSSALVLTNLPEEQIQQEIVFPSMPFVSGGGSAMSQGWNPVSMPTNINKTDVYIHYNNVSYTWNEAVNNSLILTHIYEWNGTYQNVDKFEIYKGYWLYCYNDNTFLATDPYIGTILYCGKLLLNGTGVINCSKLIISPTMYNNTISCRQINADKIEHYVDEHNVTLELPN